MIASRVALAAVLAAGCGLLVAGCASPALQRLALANAEYADGAIIYELDAQRTEVRFEVMQGDRLLHGFFRAADARLSFSGCQLASPVLEVSIATDSVDIDNSLIEAVLRGRQWFESKRFPLARFASRVVRLGSEAGEVEGELTLRDVTDPVSLNVTIDAQLQPAPMEIHFAADTEFARTRFGMSTARELVADEVQVKVDGVFVLAVHNC